MKTFLKTCFVFFLTLLFATPVLAKIVLDTSGGSGTWATPVVYVDTNERQVFSIYVTAGTSNTASATLKGVDGYLSGYCIEIDPDGTVSSYTVQLNNDMNTNILGSQGTGMDTSSTERIYLDKTPVNGDLTISFTNLTSGDSVTIKLFIDR